MKNRVLTNYFFIFTVSLLFLYNISSAQNIGKANHIIPKPNSAVFSKGDFKIDNKTALIFDEPLKTLADYFYTQLMSFSGLDLAGNKNGQINNCITLKIIPLPEETNDEYYKISVATSGVTLSSTTEKGLFRGIQTLLQLLPINEQKDNITLPCCVIEDKPAYQWRGLNLDCCRHFMSKDFIIRYIDILAHYKFNRFHLHLTDDQGWRIEIKRYPKLTSIGAWRKQADGSTHGGFYTQDELREIVAYAKSRFIDVIPEIEMPGHALAALASYPEYSCTGGPFEVTHNWGIFKDIFCAGNDSTFYFLQNVLDEVSSIFPYEYIHIGGDEAPRDRWKECPKCQARIKTENLKNEAELQTYLISRIEKYLQTKGKKIIGWDEILEGGLTEGATVQSWRGYSGVINAAKQKHNVICSPVPYTYLDYSPGFTDLRACYSFNLVPGELTAEEATHVLGSEANMWGESAPQDKIDNRLFPRLLALSEVFWTKPENKNFNCFYSRLQNHYPHLVKMGINYGAEGRTITESISFDNVKKQFTINLKVNEDGIQMRYTTNGDDPDSISPLYSAPVAMPGNSKLKIVCFRSGKALNKKPILYTFSEHKAIGAEVYLKNPYSELAHAEGESSLTDGTHGSDDIKCGRWLGFNGTDMELVIDLGIETEISKITAGFLQAAWNLTFFPESVEFSTSNDNINFTTQGKITNDHPQKTTDPVTKTFTYVFDKTKCRYIKVFAKIVETFPKFWTGIGDKPWIYIDEVVVE